MTSQASAKTPTTGGRYLYVIHYPVFSGPHNQALCLREPLLARGWETLVLLPEEPGNAVDWLRAGGVELVQMPLHRARAHPDPRLHAALIRGFWREVGSIRRLIRDQRVSVVVIGGLVNPHAAIAARLEGVPAIWQIVDTRTPRFARAILMPVVRRLAATVMFWGRGVIDAHVGRRPLGLPSTVFYPAIDGQRFQPSAERRRATRAQLGIPEDTPLVGMVANLNPQKGIEYFVRAAVKIHCTLPESRFLIVGERYETHREYTEQIEAEIERSGVPRECFIFTGGRPDTENYYAAMDVKVISSVPRSEATTSTVLEAMSCEVPVVATAVGGVPEVVDGGETGYLVPPENPEEIARGVLELLGDPGLRARMGAEGRRHVLDRYGVEACAELYLSAFQMALASNERRNGRSGGT